MAVRHKTNKALLQQHSILGCDRELILTLCVFCFVMVTQFSGALMYLLIALFFAVFASAIYYMGTKDILMRAVVMKNMHYQDYYSAKSALLVKTLYRK